MTGTLWNRWEYFSWVGFRGVNSDGSPSDKQSVDSAVSGFRYSDALNEIEGILIEVIEPKLNKQSGRLKSAAEYFQVVDDRADDVSMKQLQEILIEVNSQLAKMSGER